VVVTEALFSRGGVDAVLDSPTTELLAHLAQDLHVDATELRAELQDAIYAARVHVEGLQSKLAFGPHMIVQQTWVRVLWHRCFQNERPEWESFVAHLTRFLDVDEGVPASKLLTPDNRATLRDLLTSDGKTVSAPMVARVFHPPPTGRLSELLESVFGRRTGLNAPHHVMALRDIPALPAKFVGRDDIVAAIGKRLLTCNSTSMFLF